MNSLQDILKLIGDDNGKVFVVNEQGDVKLVVLGVAEYQKLLLGKLKRQVADIESINRAILEAQLKEPDPIRPVIAPEVPAEPVEPISKPPRQQDLRSEVVDPNFSFGTFTGDAEAIAPEFDDI